MFESNWVLALGHEFTNKFNIVHLLCDAHGLWVALKFSVNVKCRSKCVLHFFSVSSVVRAAKQVVANSFEVIWVRKVSQSTQPFDLKQQVDCLRLLIVVDELGDDLVY